MMKMKKWLKQSVMITVAFLTLGVITPMHEIWDNFGESNGSNAQAASPEVAYAAPVEVAEDVVEEKSLTEVAREQAYTKFGTRIAPKISEDFDTYIFPKIEEAIAMHCADLDNLTITENPSGGYAEKMFHIQHDARDVIRFHVRTENRPHDGFYYNFHYHVAADNYDTHHDLGEIYWSKNQPPKWLS